MTTGTNPNNDDQGNANEPDAAEAGNDRFEVGASTTAGMAAGTIEPSETPPVEDNENQADPTAEKPPAAIREDSDPDPICPLHWVYMKNVSSPKTDDHGNKVRYYKCKAAGCKVKDKTVQNGKGLDEPQYCPRTLCRTEKNGKVTKQTAMEIDLEKTERLQDKLHFVCPNCKYRTQREGRHIKRRQKRQADYLNR